MDVNKDDSFHMMIGFLHKEIPWAKTKKINEQTDIVHDLGLYGDDCIEFLEKFCQEFNLECSRLDFSKCGQEGIDPMTGMLLWILSKFKRREKRQTGYKILELMRLIENKIT